MKDLRSHIEHSVVLAALPAVLLVLAVYTWLVSIGSSTIWVGPSDYYDQLATAFRHGQLSLELRPSPALLALPNPYDPDMRKGVDFLSDASLYRGRYYFYFGPVPAFVLLIAKALVPGVIGDEYLVFAFLPATFIVLVMFMVRIWRRFFTEVSPRIVGISVLTAGLISPFGWILSSIALVHNAAIATGQFFFLAGLLAAFDALDAASIRKYRGLLAGAFWALAMGSRITEIVPITMAMAVIAVSVLRKYHGPAMLSESSKVIIAFSAPLALGALMLGAYNWARFGSIFETGISYQLAGPPLQKYMADLFSVRYAPQNLYNYLLNLPNLKYKFPYFWPRRGILKPIVPSLALPPLYVAEETTGLVFTAPILLFALAAAIPLRLGSAKRLQDKADMDLMDWLKTALGASFLGGFAVFVVFFWASERYLLDFVPAALLLAMIEFWQVGEFLKAKRFGRAVFTLVAMALIVVSLVLSNLLAIAPSANGFRLQYPELWNLLNSIFRP